MRSLLAAFAIVFLSAGIARADHYKQISALRDHAKAAIQSGNVDPQRDLGPLIEMLRTSRDDEDQRHLVDAIIDLGKADADAPAAVKRYVIEQMTPILTAIAENTKNSNFLRGDALLGLRNMGASRAALERVAAMALKDSDSYVQSRGEILENYIKSMPAQDRVETIKPKDAAKEQEALEFLRAHDLDVSVDQLTRSAAEAKPDEVRALLAAGVDVNAGDPSDAPIIAALRGCSDGPETDAIVETVEVLVKAGADMKRTDDNKNTALISAAQYCGARVIEKMIAGGADVNIVNGSTMTPLMMALIMKHFDGAEMLVAHGAKMTAEQAQVIANSVPDPRAKAITQKAMGKKKK